MSSPTTACQKNAANSYGQETKIPPKFVPTPFPYHFQLTVRIESLSDMGTGEGSIEDDSKDLPEHPENWRVRVPLVLPGELVTVKIFKNMDDYSEGRDKNSSAQWLIIEISSHHTVCS